MWLVSAVALSAVEANKMFPPPDSDDSTSKADLFRKTQQARKAV